MVSRLQILHTQSRRSTIFSFLISLHIILLLSLQLLDDMQRMHSLFGLWTKLYFVE